MMSIKKLSFMFLILLVLLLGTYHTASAGPLCTTVCYVDVATGDDANGGASWGDPLKTIQEGVNRAEREGGTVYVAAGTYYEHVKISDSVIIYGAGQENTFIDGGGSGNLVEVWWASLNMQDVTLQHSEVALWGLVASVEFTNVKIQQNSSAISINGGINLYDCAIVDNSGAGALISTNPEMDGPGGSVSLVDSVVAHNVVQNLAVNGVAYRGPAGVIKIQDSEVSHNAAEGAFFVNTNVEAPYGLGLYGGSIYIVNSMLSLNTSSGPLFSNSAGSFVQITLSTLHENHTPGNPMFSNVGGVSYSYDGPVYSHGRVDVFNSTLSANFGGSAIFDNGDLGHVTIAASTITGSPVSTTLLNSADAEMEIKNSIVTNTTGGSNCSNSGIFNVLGVNLDDDGSCGFTLTDNPLLGPLANNGGPTMTHALLEGSPAIDAVTECTDLYDNPVATDQRGVSRPQGAACDIGAYETDIVVCPEFPITANNENELNVAIGCYNDITVAGSYAINIGTDIDLTASTRAISNTIPGVELVVEGANFEVDGQGVSGVRPFEIGVLTTVMMKDLTITGGNVLLGNGGGILNYGTLTLVNSTIANNDGSGIRNTGKEDDNHGYNSGTVTLIGSTVSGNNGDGIHSWFPFTTVTLVNSTVSGNTASSGGIVIGFGTLTLINSTVSGNDGGGILNNYSTVTLTNSIIADQIGGTDCIYANDETSDPITSNGHNLDSDGTCGLTGVGDIPNGNADLLPLALNAPGSTATHALGVNSDALDAGDDTVCAAAPVNGVDQRGVSRPQGAACDIGAYEGSESICPEFPVNVADENELNEAIACYNDITDPGSYEITLTSDILLTATTTHIDNPTDGVNLTINGQDNSVDGQLLSRVLYIESDTDVTINHLVIQNGRPTHDVGPEVGGGIYNLGSLNINDSILTGNMAAVGAGGGDADYRGGAIYNGINGNVEMSNCTLDGNRGDAGGGIFNDGDLTVINSNFLNNQSFGGGGISNAGFLSLKTSTLTNNHTYQGGGLANRGTAFLVQNTISNNNGGWEGGGIFNTGILDIRNSTISGNRVEADGGGIKNLGELRLVHSTLANNSAYSDWAEGSNLYASGYTEIKNSLIADAAGGAEDCYSTSTIIWEGINLVEDGSCDAAANGQLTGDPLLGPLANNGGPTMTHALLEGSPAIDAVTECTDLDDNPVTTDQRGVSRPQGAACDIGAYEQGDVEPPICDPDPVNDLDLSYIDSEDSSHGVVINTSDACTYDVGMASYRRVDYEIDHQTLFDSEQGSIGPGETVEFTVELPSCAAQVDLFYGPLLLDLEGVRYGTRLLDGVLVGGNNFCTGLGEAIVEWNFDTPISGQMFQICLTGPSYPDGYCKEIEAASASYPDISFATLFDNLLPGEYTVWQVPPSDEWEVVGWGSPITVTENWIGTAWLEYTYIPPEDDDATTGTDVMNGGDDTNNPPDGGNGDMPPTCDDPDPGRDLKHGGSHLNAPGYSSGVIVNLSDTCSYIVGMASYQMVDNTTDNQILFDYTAGVVIGPGESVNLSVSLPGCAAQVDLFYGDLIQDFVPGLRYGERLIDGAYIDWGSWCAVSGG